MGDTPLIVCCRKDEEMIQTVLFLLRKGANPDAVGKGNRTALHWAAAKDHKNIVQILLQVVGRETLYIQNRKGLIPLQKCKSAIVANAIHDKMQVKHTRTNYSKRSLNQHKSTLREKQFRERAHT